MRALLLFLILATHMHGAGLGPYNPAQHAVNGFMPTQLPGLALWLDAGRQGYTNSTSVTQWNDFGANKKHATNETSGFKPVFVQNALNGKSAIKFDGVDDFLSCSTSIFPTNSIGYICFFALQSVTNAISQPFIAQRANGASRRFVYILNQDLSGAERTNAIRIFHEGATDGSGTGGAPQLMTNQSPVVFVTLNNSGGALAARTYNKFSVVDSFTLNGAANLPLWIGSAFETATYFNGSIMEVIVGSNALSVAQLSQLHRYLGTKYGIVVQ